MAALEETGLTPADRGFYAAARTSVIDLGIVRRRKVDVASDIPARRVADLPVELDDEAGRSIRAAEQELARRLVARYEAALAARPVVVDIEGIDHDLVRRVAAAERKNAGSDKTGDNVFTVMRKIGQAKAGLAADYAAQLARNVGKVVFFAKHIDVMDAAEQTFAKRGVGYASIRGDQTPKVRKANIEAFLTDPDVAVVVCSLTAAGVGLNLQVASNLVLAELSWTSAEQTQAIDRVHRIGQTEPVTAWRIIAAQTIDSRLAELIDDKAGLAARALDGSDEEVGSSADVQLEALVSLLTEALTAPDGVTAARGTRPEDAPRPGCSIPASRPTLRPARLPWTPVASPTTAGVHMGSVVATPLWSRTVSCWHPSGASPGRRSLGAASCPVRPTSPPWGCCGASSRCSPRSTTRMAEVDVTDLTFCDVASAHLLLTARRRVPLVLSGATGSVKRVFDLLDVLQAQRLPMYRSLARPAEQSMRPRPFA